MTYNSEHELIQHEIKNFIEASNGATGTDYFLEFKTYRGFTLAVLPYDLYDETDELSAEKVKSYHEHYSSMATQLSMNRPELLLNAATFKRGASLSGALSDLEDWLGVRGYGLEITRKRDLIPFLFFAYVGKYF